MSTVPLKEEHDMDAISVDSYWSASGPSRFPIKPEDWASRRVLPTLPAPLVVGAHRYELDAMKCIVHGHACTLDSLTAKYPDDFRAAAEIFTASEYRTLFWLDRYPLARLGDAAFDPSAAFRDIANVARLHQIEVPPTWRNCNRPTSEVLEELDPHGRFLVPPDVGKAAYCIISYARSLGLLPCEVAVLPFWELDWIRNCIAAYL